MKHKAVVVTVLLMIALAASLSRDGALRAQPAPDSPSGDKAVFEDKGDVVRINFPKMELQAVLEHMSAITGKNFIMDQAPKGEVLMIGPIGPVEIPRKEAFNFFILILNVSGYQVVETSVSNVYKVVRSADAMVEGARIVGPGQRVEPNDEMIIRFVNLRYVSAGDLASQISQLSSKNGGKVIAYQPTNTLIIVDTAYNIKRMIKIIGYLDVASPEPEIEIVVLKYAEANEVAGILGQIYTGNDSSPSPRTANTRAAIPTPRGRRPTRAPTPQPTATVVTAGSAGPEVKIIPVERINGLVIIADRDTIAAIKEMIAKLDIDVGGVGAIHVYYCQNAEASELASTLASLTGRGSSVSPSTTSRTTQNEPMGGIRGAMTQPPTTSTRSRTTKPTTAGGQTAVISGLLAGDVTITSDEATNSLIIVASNSDYEIIKKVIEQLDIPRRQVFVEAVLLEVTYNESRQYGSSIHGASPLDQNGLILSGTQLGDVSSISVLSSISSSGGSLALPSGITMGALASPVDVATSAGTVSIPSAGMIVRLLASTSSVNVLSTPTILTTDNEEASIEVGQKIPVPTGSSIGTGYSNVSITRESVGIKLQLTPQINESDNVKLQIAVEISGVVADTLGIDVNQLGVTTSIKSAETTVIVKDSQTIVIGGLMEDRQDQSQSWVPFLGDIPVLGWLFKSASQNKQKSNLIILLTPHIVKSEADIRRVRRKVQDDYRGLIKEESLTEPKYVEDLFEPNNELPPDTTIKVEHVEDSNTVDQYNWRWSPVESETEPAEAAPTEPAPEKTPAAATEQAAPGRSATTRDEVPKP